MHQGTIVLTGTRTNATGLWIVDATTRRTATITAHPAHHTASAPACYSIARPCPPMATLEQRIAFLHAAMCDPALSTLCSAIDAGFLSSFPEITSALVRKYPPPVGNDGTGAPGLGASQHGYDATIDHLRAHGAITKCKSHPRRRRPVTTTTPHRRSEPRAICFLHTCDRSGLHRPDRSLPSQVDRGEHRYAGPLRLR